MDPKDSYASFVSRAHDIAGTVYGVRHHDPPAEENRDYIAGRLLVTISSQISTSMMC